MRERGITHATTKEIAQAAGVSEGALYKHFPSKTDLFLSAMKALPSGMIASLHQLLEGAGQGSVKENLLHLAEDALLHYTDVIPMAAGLYADRDLLNLHRRALEARGAGPHLANGMVAAYLRAEQELGRVTPDADAEAAAYALLGACYQRVQWAFYLGKKLTRPQRTKAASALADLLWHGLAPRARS